MSGRKMGLRACLDWLFRNDDCGWLDDPDSYPTVAAYLVADMFGKSPHDLRRALIRRRSDWFAARERYGE